MTWVKGTLTRAESLIIGVTYPVVAPIIAVGAFKGDESDVLLSGKAACTLVADTGVGGNVTEMTKAA